MKINYLHTFGYWAAARAIHNPKNPGIKTKQIKVAIEKSGLYDLMINPKKLKNFDTVHHEIASSLMKELKLNQDKFGIVAKIIAIYLKATVIIPARIDNQIVNKIYPPIDSNNLKRISGVKKEKWTELKEKKFKEVIDALKLQLKVSKSNFIEFESGVDLTT